MTRIECELESEVLAAVLERRWHFQSDLQAHAAACPVCSEVLAVSSAMDHSREVTAAQAAIPDSGRMWWIAQLRARREAAKEAGRPITAAQVIAFGCVMGLFGACFGATSAWFQSALQRLAAAVAAIDAPALFAGHGLLILVAGAVLLLLPAAVCFAMFRD